MTDRPIIFSTPMVRALLAGTKTQTRRICKLEVRHSMPEPEWKSLLRCCPYGQPGDRLWVRETFKKFTDGYAYRANHWDLELADSVHAPWKPSIHMPRAASRITLKITNVRVEKLHEISKTDAIAEGLYQDQAGRWTTYSASEKHREHLNPIEAYKEIFEKINGAKIWDTTPWVWVIEFSRVEAA